MKRFFTSLVLLCFFFTAFAQEDKEYVMYETIYLMPKSGQSDAFEKAVKEHDQKFHSKDPHKAIMRSISNGVNTGWYVWIMGPTTFTHLDSRPGKGAHDDDWNKKVVPLIDKAKWGEYWKLIDDLSYTKNEMNPENLNTYVNILNLKPGTYYRFKEMMMKVKEVYEANNYDENLLVFNNTFNSNDGRDVGYVIPFSNWSWFDEDGKLRKDFDKLHGEGAWNNIMKEWMDIVEGSAEEVRIVVK